MKLFTKQSLLGLFLVPAMVLGTLVLAPSTYATDPNADPPCDTSNGVNVSEGALCSKGTNVKGSLFASGGIFETISNVLLFLIGAISVIMLIIGGFRYVVSNGDSTAVTAAKNTILYAIIGIIVALLAFAIVKFVISSFTNNATGSQQRAT